MSRLFEVPEALDVSAKTEHATCIPADHLNTAPLKDGGLVSY